jgi:PAS domain S-box-containing protein
MAPEGLSPNDLPQLDVTEFTTLSGLLELAHDAIVIRTIEGTVLFWNRGAERLYGWSAEEATGRNMQELLHVDAGTPLERIHRDLISDGQWEGLLNQVCKDGTRVTVESRWALQRISGASTPVLEINRDITARLAAEENVRRSERKLRFITDSAPILLAHCDREERFKFVNKSYAARFGTVPGMLVGRTIQDVVGEAAYRTIQPYVRKALNGESVDVELEIHYEKLGRHFIRFGYEPELDDAGNVVGFVAAIQNVSDRRKIEEELRERDRRKDEFLATLAHELRNPLAPMRYALELFRAGGDPADLMRAHGVLDRQLRQLVKLIDDLLDVSRITRGRLEIDTDIIELRQVIAAAVEATPFATDTARQTLTVSLPDDTVHLRGDSMRLAQVFLNLLNNAAKYTPPGGHVELSATAADGEVTITVSDSGVGIPSAMLGRIFDMFVQVDSTREQVQGGLGIGLTLVRQLIELHGGTIEAHSDGENRGSRFIVRLPVAAAPETPTRVGDAASARVTTRRILIADDNADAAELLEMWLKMAGHEVRSAQDGEAALIVAETMQPDVLLLDIGMPKVSGYEVARRIREKPWGSRAMLIALTGWGQEEDLRRSREAGFDHHLTKPVDPSAIDALIAGAV